MDDLYTELITEHSRSTEHRKHLENPTSIEHGHNPSCGDDITLEVKIENGIISEASFNGVGCAISQASTDMMIDLMEGKSVEEARRLIDLFIRMIKSELNDDDDIEELDEAATLENISNLPARVKCAVLAWRTLDRAIIGSAANDENRSPTMGQASRL